jgi:uncharacterized protein
MERIELFIRGISYSQTQSGAYVLILEHSHSGLTMPVVIGNFEAQAISLALEKDLISPRPLTHDLLKNTIESLNHQLKEVEIYRMVDGVFYSYITIQHQNTGAIHQIDARTSDAVALAVRFSAPIFTTEQVMNQAGVLLETDDEDDEEDENFESLLQEDDEDANDLSKYSLAELNKMLQEAVEVEDYDLAIHLKAEISQRNA